MQDYQIKNEMKKFGILSWDFPRSGCCGKYLAFCSWSLCASDPWSVVTDVTLNTDESKIIAFVN